MNRSLDHQPTITSSLLNSTIITITTIITTIRLILDMRRGSWLCRDTAIITTTTTITALIVAIGKLREQHGWNPFNRTFAVLFLCAVRYFARYS
jgi:hypothetical protein